MFTRRSRGFTLIEVLIAAAVFAVLGIMVSAILHHSIKVRNHLQSQQKRWFVMNRLLFDWGNDLRQVMNRPVRDSGYNLRNAFSGAPKHLAYTTLTRHGLERTEYLFQSHEIIKRRWPVLDRATTTKPIDSVVLRDVATLAFHYVDSGRHMRNDWPARTGSNRRALEPSSIFPRAVRVEGSVRGVGSFQMTYPIAARGAYGK